MLHAGEVVPEDVMLRADPEGLSHDVQVRGDVAAENLRLELGGTRPPSVCPLPK